ncbi:uncharacterized protein PRCAT00004993001 [Priceomyces carsonii]|uniref:uncharacterized protein n=1 Tax=Priceomyces carsonii TaxID=28549 RepID=UPI002EDABFF0|nr:unnamed protein product [Priceomyces carsonii]
MKARLSFSAIILFFALLIASVNALQLEIQAKKSPQATCIRDFALQGQLVVVNIKTSGRSGDGQQLDLRVVDLLGNEHRHKSDIAGSTKVAFTSHHNAAFDVCFENHLVGHGSSRSNLYREVELDVESGASARDWNALQTAEKLKPVEVELIRIKETTQEIVSELQYLKRREEKMRDTNESTNSRVKWFSILIIGSLVGLGAWQIQYLRYYFKVKHII